MWGGCAPVKVGPSGGSWSRLQLSAWCSSSSTSATLVVSSCALTIRCTQQGRNTRRGLWFNSRRVVMFTINAGGCQVDRSYLRGVQQPKGWVTVR
jgi:hypothetical protein